MKKIVILGSTGSIGTNTLEVIRRDPAAFQVVGLAAGGNVDLLAAQIDEFHPEQIAMAGEEDISKLPARAEGEVELLHGEEGLIELVSGDADLVVVAIPGTAALLPALEAIRRGKDIALASKELLVAAGEEVISRAAKSGSAILPVDSEHSAIFQCLRGEKNEEVEKIVLTASGGPFLNAPLTELKEVTPGQALNHPRWKMGRKVTLDSATLMNKGLEVLEAHWLFDMPLDRIEVVIHPQSIIHSMIQTRDGSILAQMSQPDMKLPISCALYYPARSPHSFQETVMSGLEPLTFQGPDRELFPSLDLAYQAGTIGGTLPAVMNAANEVAGEAFLEGRIGFLVIMEIVENVMKEHQTISAPGLSEIIEADRWARDRAEEMG
ncbi:MAG: 1-deoxy-D-xylulose-5-phosphate reductoisomerase [Candidatus Auribacterota bacterium]|nr:1-deoxy-D-xylulose-5-phosphate reductoisomerase [Candidatus Auribacterota bacterium]